jgi:hypothetical protein
MLGGLGRAMHDGEPTGRRKREEMAAASFTAAMSLAPLAVRSDDLLLCGLLRHARREQARLLR